VRHARRGKTDRQAGRSRRRPAPPAGEDAGLQERIAKIAASAPGVLYSFHLRPDGTSCFLYASAGVERIYGVRPDELITDAEPAFARIHPDDLARVRASIAESARTLTPWRCEFRVSSPTGEVWVDGNSQPEARPDGGVVWHGFLSDVTGQKRTEHALRESEERFHSLYESTTVGLYRTTPDGRIVLANPAAVRMLGYDSFEELGGRNLETSGFEPEYPRREFRARLERDGLIVGLETIWVRRDGSRMWVRESARLVRGQSGAPLYYDGTFEDITERKRAEDALRQSEARYRTLVESAPEAILVLDVERARFVEANENAERLFGLTRDELLRMRPIELCPPRQPTGEESLAAAQAVIEQVLAGERPVVDWTCRSASGEDIACEVWLARVPADRLLIRGAVVDVRTRRHLEDQLRQAQKIEAVGRLAGGVAHDFNNLLSIITGYSEMALRALGPDHPARARIVQVTKAAERGAGLTRQLLAFSRRQVLQPRVVDLNALLADLGKMLQRLIGEDVELAFRLAEGLGAVRVDPGQMEQVIMNLAVNARDAMPRGGRLIIDTTAVDLREPLAVSHGRVPAGAHVKVTVSDTGHGMDSPTMARLFEPFFTTKPAGEGTGLGLAMVYGIVQQSGGAIGVRSAVGEGTTFELFLPRIEEEAVAPALDQGAPPSLRGSETVLLVEDLESLRTVLQEILESLGYAVLAADGADAAIARVRAHSGAIDLLITDVVMPGTGGRELAARLKTDRPDLRVLYMSGYTNDVLGRQGVIDEELHLIGKPFTTDVLARRLRQVLGSA
jgi:two-component system cell cycle sensor histidine kinase/response regulator CckA